VSVESMPYGRIVIHPYRFAFFRAFA